MSDCNHEISELLDDGGACRICGRWHSWRFWYDLHQDRIKALEAGIRAAIGTGVGLDAMKPKEVLYERTEVLNMLRELVE